MNTWILSTKVFLLSAVAVCLAMVIKSTVPVIFSDVVLSWLRPPYLYILVNGIIITIAASSRFNRIQSEPHVQSQHHPISVGTPPPVDFASSSVATVAYETPAVNFACCPVTSVSEEPPVVAAAAYESDDIFAGLKPVMANGSEVLNIGRFKEETVVEGADDMFGGESKLTYSTLAPDTLFSAARFEQLAPEVREKPLISSSSGHRKTIRSTSQRVKTRRVTKHETLDSVWKRITEGASRATHEAPPEEVRRKLVAQPLPPPGRLLDQVLKSESIKDRESSHDSPTILRIRREQSLSQDELNRRVEAFIKKFNEERRLEREKSLDKY